MKNGDEYLTPLQREWSISMTADMIKRVENDKSLERNLRGMKLRELRLVMKIKLIQDRMLLEDEVRKKLGQKRVGGNYQPHQVATVLGITERQATTIEKKALSKLKSPSLGKRLRSTQFN